MAEESEDTDVPRPRSRRRWQWFIALSVFTAGIAVFLNGQSDGGDSTSIVDETEPSGLTAPTELSSSQEVLAQEMAGNPLPPAQFEDGSPIPASAATEPAPVENSPPPPVTVDPSAAPVSGAWPEPSPPATSDTPRPPAEKKAPARKTKKHALVFSKAGTKVPKALNKDKVTAYLAKQLDGNKTCLPADLGKKELKPFTAIVNISAKGTVTAVVLQNKMSKSVSACIKKKISGNPAVFKSKGKGSNRLIVAFKVK